MTDRNALLEVSHLSARYQRHIVALEDISLTVGEGEIVALLGRNGAGKSTTLQAISHLLPARRGEVSAGRVLWRGTDITAEAPHRLVKRGIVPVLEGRHCFVSLTLEENLIAGALARSASRAEIRQGLEEIYQIFPRLKDKRQLAAGLASGGEQQMAAIGRALMAKPQLLLLDEPSMGLAPLIVEEIFAVLTRLNQQKKLSILVAEQNSTVALRHAHRAYVLDTGSVALSGSAQALSQQEDVQRIYLGFAA
ncbi:ABC transporter ATP-binding protein [Erwinia sp. JUb26]|uniref:ABC transporter ATP-binding protein n=1 Tax=Erwinia sp. JUb26 TaxID=2485126 RepID=UPI000F4784BA|nr:ABC transporter ATP-binding protein [Erwinia sp. JUb26]ROR08908.1 amino acid/amide ABC transporter ATP-binding protein 2 (HAAT family) [Erwinia sp. JUb26]